MRNLITRKLPLNRYGIVEGLKFYVRGTVTALIVSMVASGTTFIFAKHIVKDASSFSDSLVRIVQFTMLLAAFLPLLRDSGRGLSKDKAEKSDDED